MRSFKLTYLIILVFSFTLLFITPAFSQSTTAGDIAGTVTDPSGAVVPNAQITAKSKATGAIQKATSNNEGFYRFSLLHPGSYTVEASAPGFQAQNTQVEVGVGQASTANIRLAVSGATTTIEVTTQGTQVENGDLSTSFSTQQIANVPNPGNDLSAIAQSAPGVVMNTQAGQGNFSTFGISATSNLFTLDGQNDNDPFLNLNNSGATNLLLGSNEIQEATVVNNGYSGQYGQLAGSQVNYVTKSGENTFHGNAVYFWNGKALNANSWFNKDSGTPKAFDNANQWALSFGGPIKKGKTFFFFDYEGLRVVLPTSAPAFIPSPGFEAGTIANLNATGHAASVPFYQNMFNLYNAANGAAGATPFAPCAFAVPGLNATDPCILKFQSTAGNFTHEYLMALRIDHKFSDNDTLFGRMQTDRGVQATVTDPISSAFNVQSTQPEYQGQLGETHLFGPNAVNEFKTSGQWYTAIFTNPNRTATLAAFPTTLTFGDGSFSNLGGAIGEIIPQGRNVTQYQVVDDFSLNHGKHTWKFGVNYHRNDVTDFSPQEFTQGFVIANSLQDFFNGGQTGDTLVQRFPSKKSQPIALYGLGIYAQDEWRATNKLKLTLALRVDHNSNPVCQTNCFSRLVTPFTSISHDPNIPYNQAILFGQHQAYPGTDFVVWQPRVGFTFSPFSGDKTVIRGGIGIFSDSFPATIADSFLNNPPTLGSFTPTGLPISPGEPSNLFNAAAAANSAFQAGFANGATFSSLTTQLAALGIQFVAPNFQTTDKRIRQPRYQEWNLEVQQEIGWHTILSVNYVGNHGIFEPVQNNGLNAFGFGGLPAAPTDQRFGTVTQIQSTAVSNYNGLVTSVRHAFNHGFQFQANYTWSHALDEISNGGFLSFDLGTAPSVIFPQNPFNLRGNYGNSDYDVRRYFSANYVWDNSLRHLFHWGPNAVFSGWTFSGTIFNRSGLPFTVVNGAATSALAGNNYGGAVFANIIGPTQINGCGHSTAGANGMPCLNINGFTDSAAQSTFGNQGRNQFRGPGYFDTDFTVMKKTKITEKTELGIGFQFFNILNHPNFDKPVADISNPSFGLINRAVSTPTSILGSFLGGDASPRLIQLKAQFSF